MAHAELDELGVAANPPLSPTFRSSPNHLLQPKPRRPLSEDQFEPLPPAAGSPFKMQLIESLDPHDSLDSNTIHSLAGQLNVRQLSRDGTDDACEPMIRRASRPAHIQPTYTMLWARGEEARRRARHSPRGCRRSRRARSCTRARRRRRAARAASSRMRTSSRTTRSSRCAAPAMPTSTWRASSARATTWTSRSSTLTTTTSGRSCRWSRSAATTRASRCTAAGCRASRRRCGPSASRSAATTSPRRAASSRAS